MSAPDIFDRFVYHPPRSRERVVRHETARAAIIAAVLRLDPILPEGHEREKTLAKLEEALMWANAAIAREPQQE